MESVNDLIIVHFQKGFFTTSNQKIKNTVKATLEPIIKKALKANVHVSFWEDPSFDNTTSIIEIPSNDSRFSRVPSPAGVTDSYTLHGAEITLTGGWFGACIKNAVRSIMKAFFKNLALIKTGELTIRMPAKAVYDKKELLADMSDSNIGDDLVDAVERSTILTKLEVKERGLQVRVIKSKTQETIKEQIIVKVPKDPTLQIFDIVFLID